MSLIPHLPFVKHFFNNLSAKEEQGPQEFSLHFNNLLSTTTSQCDENEFKSRDDFQPQNEQFLEVQQAQRVIQYLNQIDTPSYSNPSSMASNELSSYLMVKSKLKDEIENGDSMKNDEIENGDSMKNEQITNNSRPTTPNNGMNHQQIENTQMFNDNSLVEEMDQSRKSQIKLLDKNFDTNSSDICGIPDQNGSRTIFTYHQESVLEKSFRKKAHPENKELTRLCYLLSLPQTVIRTWFKNKRQKNRLFEEVIDSARDSVIDGKYENRQFGCKKCNLKFSQFSQLFRHQKDHCFKRNRNQDDIIFGVGPSFRTTILPEQLNFLNVYYQNVPYPTPTMLEDISRAINLDLHDVKVWFINSHARDVKDKNTTAETSTNLWEKNQVISHNNFDYFYQYYVQNERPILMGGKPSMEFLLLYHQINEFKVMPTQHHIEMFNLMSPQNRLNLSQ